MKRHLRYLFLFILLAGVILIVTGCGAQPSTQMTVQDGFSGERTMSCTLSGSDMAQITGGESALDALLRQQCPAALTWDKQKQNGNTVYTFTLSFSDQQDYREKVESLLGRECYLLYAVPDGAFTQGVRLEEDFSSGDLMAWLGRALVDGGLSTQELSFFSGGSAQVAIQNRTFSCQDRIAIQELSYHPVNKITIETYLSEEETFDRTISISIPESTCNQLGDALQPYLDGLVPSGGVSRWEENAAGRTFVIFFTAQSSRELEDKTAQALDSPAAQSVTEQQKETLFNSQVVFTERLNFSSFLSNRDGKTYVEYLFDSGSSSGISTAQMWKSGQWMDMDGYLEDSQFLFQEDSALLQVRLQSRNEFSMESMNIDMRRLSEGLFHREISFAFSGESGVGGALTAARYFRSLGIAGLSTSVEENRCILSMEGAPSELSQILTALFGPGNEISLSNGEGFQLYHSTSVNDQMDLQAFLQESGYAGEVSYVYTGDEPISSLTQDRGDGIQSIRVDEATIRQEIPADGKTLLTATVRWLNAWFVAMLCGAALLCLCIAGGIFFLVRRHFIIRRESARVTPAQDFPTLDRKCPSCGAQLYQGMLFCTKCGFPIFYEETEGESHSHDQSKKRGKKRHDAT